MACCAFAVFLLMRLLAPLRALARVLGLGGQMRMDAAVGWRPGLVPAAAALPRPRPVLRRLLAAEAALLALLAGPAVASVDSAAPRATTPDPVIVALIHKNICKPLGWRN